MDPISATIAVASAVSQFASANKAKKKEKQISQANAELDRLNQDYAKLEATRNIRDVVRRSQAARSIAVNAGANSGAGLDSSSIQGGIANATGQQNLQINAIDDNLESGLAIGAQRSRISGLGGQLREIQSEANIARTIGNNAPAISRVANQFNSVGSTSIGPWETTVTPSF